MDEGDDLADFDVDAEMESLAIIKLIFCKSDIVAINCLFARSKKSSYAQLQPGMHAF